jgi:hypothetical protein
VRQARSRLSARGRLQRQADDTHASLRVAASRWIFAALAGCPSTRIELVANANLDADQTGSHGNYRVSEQWFEGRGRIRAPSTLEGELQAPAARPLRTTGTLEIAEPGCRDAHRLQRQLRSDGVKCDGRDLLQHPARAPGAAARADGPRARGKLEVRAAVDSAAEQIDADVAVDLRDVRHPP